MNERLDNRLHRPGDGPRSSIVICVYNRGDEVQACLKSLLELTDRDFEIVLVDDCSTDDTPERLAAFQDAHRDVSVTIVRNQTNLGVSGARNTGVDAATGRFVLFTDSDCEVDPHWLERILVPFEDPSTAGVGGTVLNPEPETYAERAYVGRSRIVPSMAQARHLVGCNMAYRREAVARLRFDEALTYGCDEDDLARRLIKSGYRIAFAPDAVVHHRHRLTARSYMRMARRQGQGAARHWYKHGRYVGRDLLPIVAAIATLPLALIDAKLLLLPAAFATAQLAAIAYNEYHLKGKGVVETLTVLPMAVLYYVFKLTGYLQTAVSLLAGGESKIRTSKARWKQIVREGTDT